MKKCRSLNWMRSVPGCSEGWIPPPKKEMAAPLWIFWMNGRPNYPPLVITGWTEDQIALVADASGNKNFPVQLNAREIRDILLAVV